METATRNLPETPRTPEAQGNIKATREDWIRAALDTLVDSGVSEVKILGLATRLDVSRSSFYWYFRNRTDLLASLLDHWEDTNTQALVAHTRAPADTITQAVAHFFRCFLNPLIFDQKLDFAVREWSRRDADVRQKVRANDMMRQAAIQAMFERHGYAPPEADIRARILYYQQIGYYALDLAEPLAERQARVAGYLEGFTGVTPSQAEVAAARAYAAAHVKDAD